MHISSDQISSIVSRVEVWTTRIFFSTKTIKLNNKMVPLRTRLIRLGWSMEEKRTNNYSRWTKLVCYMIILFFMQRCRKGHLDTHNREILPWPRRIHQTSNMVPVDVVGLFEQCFILRDKNIITKLDGFYGASKDDEFIWSICIRILPERWNPSKTITYQGKIRRIRRIVSSCAINSNF